MLHAQGDLPPTLTLTAIARDLVSAGNPQGIAPVHPHFNTCVGTAQGIVQPNLSINAAGDTTLGDNRNPVISANPPAAGCVDPPARFAQWYNDADPSINRKFKYDLVLQLDQATGQYTFANNAFFIMDPGVPRTKFNPTDPDPFGDIFTTTQGTHNYGFTLELHTEFTYYQGTDQVFTFTGDDDVWVFVNDVLVLDLGGVHGPLTATFSLDDIAATVGLQNFQNYKLDFFYAERHTVESNARITTFPLRQAPDRPADLKFVDKNGTPIPAGTFYSPAEGNLYLLYSDDAISNLKVNGALTGNDQKTLTLTLTNANASTDAVTSVTGIAERADELGHWLFTVPLDEAEVPIPADAVLQTWIKSLVTAEILVHDGHGTQSATTKLTATLNVAYPNVTGDIKLYECADTTASVTRTSTCVGGKLTNQTLTKNVDIVNVELTCESTGDKVTVIATETGAVTGQYEVGHTQKQEGTAIPGDAILQCGATETIIARYVDPVYGDEAGGRTTWIKPGDVALNFTVPGNPGQVITTMIDGQYTAIQLVALTSSPNPAVIDQLTATLSGPGGEVESVVLTETGVNSGVFEGTLPYRFQSGAVTPGNGTAEVQLNPDSAGTTRRFTATVSAETRTVSATLDAQGINNPVVKAWIKDANGNGAADVVYLQFANPLTAVPSTFSANWNQAGISAAAPPVLSVSGNLLVATYSGGEFPVGLTAIAPGGEPSAQLPDDNVFVMQNPALEDSIGPIIDSARVFPFDVSQLENQPRTNLPSVGVDTLVIYLSESVKTKTDYTQLIRFSKPVSGACTDYANSQPVTPDGEVVFEDVGGGKVKATILVSEATGTAKPLAGDCVFLNTNGNFFDEFRNLPPEHGKRIEGRKPPKEIELMRGYPPVVGCNASTPCFSLSSTEDKNETNELKRISTLTESGYQVLWIPPVGFDPNNPNAFFVPNGLNDQGYVPLSPSNIQQISQDPTRVTAMPTNLSALQVVSSGRYVADVTIFDNLGNFIRKFRQSFGYQGELNNIQRAVSKGMVSYLLWDLHDQKGQRAGQGVFVWKVLFTFENGKQEVQYTRTGVLRDPSSFLPARGW